MKRHFIVSYIGTEKQLGCKVTGQINMTCEKGFYLNRKITTNIISEQANISDVVIIFILEVDESDWATWIETDSD